MKLVTCMPVRNEADCLGLTARVALMWCDLLIMFLHSCTDRSTEIATELAAEFNPRVLVVGDYNPQWDEMRHRQAMLELARTYEMAATHIAIVDADEILTGNLVQTCAASRMIESMTPGQIMQLPGYNLRGSVNKYHANGVWGNRWFSVAFEDDPRLSWSGDKFHSREPQGIRLSNYRPLAQGQGGVMHLWGASEKRLIAKHALYKMTERLRWPQRPVEDIDTMYSWAIKGDPGNYGFLGPDKWSFKETPAEWWAPYSHLMKYLDVDAEPWQAEECVRLMKEHGPRMFQGLDLFGVA